MKKTVINNKRIDLVFPKLGCVMLSRFSDDYDNGLYRSRPWHVVTFGRNFATVEECVSFLETIVANWDDSPNDNGEWKGVNHGETTHSFLATEAALDSCPY